MNSGHTRKCRGEARIAVDGIGVTLTDQNFQTVVLESPQPGLIAFAAEGCGAWHLLAPKITVIEEAFRGRVTVATLAVEAQPQAPERYGVGTLPALLFFQDGRVVDQLIIVVDRTDMAATRTPRRHATTNAGSSSKCGIVNFTITSAKWRCRMGR
jgi:thioredoxin 1